MSKDLWTWVILIILTLVGVVWVHHSVSNWRPPPPEPEDNQEVRWVEPQPSRTQRSEV